MFTTFRYLSLSSLLLAGISFSGCESIEGRLQEAGLDENFDEKVTGLEGTAGRSHGELEELERQRLRRGDYAIRVNRTLIYPCRWLRAEDLAQTLRPLLESRYGPGVRIVPHAVTNQLLIYIPPLHEQESVTRRAVSTASTGRSRTVNSFGGTTIRRSGR